MKSDDYLLPLCFYKKDLWMIVEQESIFSYINNTTSSRYPLMEKLQQVLLSRVFKSTNKQIIILVFSYIFIFEAKLKQKLNQIVLLVLEAYDTKRTSLIFNKI